MSQDLEQVSFLIPPLENRVASCNPQVELERQNQRLDKLDVALGNLHHVSKTVGDELEEQITYSSSLFQIESFLD